MTTRKIHSDVKQPNNVTSLLRDTKTGIKKHKTTTETQDSHKNMQYNNKDTQSNNTETKQP